MVGYILILIVIQGFVSADEHWGYEDIEGELGPDHWYLKYKTCIGNRQSPIDVEKEYVEYDPTLKPLTFKGYGLLKEVPVTNDGHTVRVDLPDDCQIFLVSESFNSSYRLKQFHFHWSHDDSNGSEHAVYKRHYPLEMHLVHADETVSFDQSLTEPFGLVVVSVLFEFGNSTDGMIKLTNSFTDIKDPKQKNETTIRDLNLLDLLPVNVDKYLQYAGSLTTPPCNEAVKWIILNETNFITHSQMDDFRSLKRVVTENGKITEEDFETNDRPLQDIKGRKVYASYKLIT
jgi:carbonic anhydrase